MENVLENFFGVIRARGGLHDHPDALQFKYRLRSYILGKNEGSLSDCGNVEVDNTVDADLEISKEQILSGQLFDRLAEEQDQDSTEVIKKDQDITEVVEKELGCLEYDGLQYLAGFICHKLKINSNNDLQDNLFTWVDHISEGGLTKPTEEFMTFMEELENIFHSVNKDSLLISKTYLKHLLSLATAIPCNDSIKTLFFRSRMYFRIKKLNKELFTNKISTMKQSTRKRKCTKICT